MATSEWVPDAQTLHTIIGLLQQANVADTNVQRRLAEAISALDGVLDAPCYYCYIFVECVQEKEDVRQHAGLLLKSRLHKLVEKSGSGRRSDSFRSSNASEVQPVSANASVPPEHWVLEYVKRNVMKAICDPSAVVRSTAGTILTAIISCQGAERFSDLLPFLFQLLDHPDIDIRATSFRAITMVIEDEVERGTAATSPTFVDFCETRLLPKLFSASENDAAFRFDALVCLNHFQRAGLFVPGDVLGMFFELYWKTLGQLALDPSPAVRQQVISGMVQVALITPEAVFKNLSSLLPFILKCLESSQPYTLKLESTELLSILIDSPLSFEYIEKSLSVLLPQLLDNTRYSEWDYLQMDHKQLEDENDTSPDDAQDLAPQFRRGIAGKHSEGDDQNDDEDDGEEESKSTWGTDWTLRKASAVVIDNMASIYGDSVLPVLLPHIESRLQDTQHWELRETAVLTVGAIARGCLSGLEPFLPKVLEMLLRMCDDPKPILRSISVWTISRFALWISPQPEVLSVVVTTILSHILDRNKCVQEASCSAFACLEEEARDRLLPHLPAVLTTFERAFRTFQAKNMVVLMDTIVALAEGLGPAIDIPPFHTQLFEPLLQRWAATPRTDPTLVVLFECVSCILFPIRQSLPRYAPMILHRCLDVIREILNECDALRLNTSSHNEMIAGGETLECAWDVVSILCGALQSNIQPLVQANDTLDLLQRCFTVQKGVPVAGLKRGCFAVIGDLAEHAAPILASRIPEIVPELTRHIANGPVAASHNASWAIGQIALYAAPQQLVTPQRPSFEVYVESMVQELSRVMVLSEGRVQSANLVRNACLTVGRLALRYAHAVADPLAPVFGMCCDTLAQMVDKKEKLIATQGLCNVANIQQVLVVSHFPAFLRAVCSLYASNALENISAAPGGEALPSAWTNTVPPSVHEGIASFLSNLKVAHTAEWEAAQQQLDPKFQNVLRRCFAL